MHKVKLEWYSLDLGQVGVPTGERLEFQHRTLKAATRRLGSIIGGKLRPLIRTHGGGVRLFIETPDGRQLPLNAARAELRAQEAAHA